LFTLTGVGLRPYLIEANSWGFAPLFFILPIYIYRLKPSINWSNLPYTVAIPKANIKIKLPIIFLSKRNIYLKKYRITPVDENRNSTKNTA
jgi:hypothetical protein